ncbi:MAG: hypothetical protein ABSH09_02410 [Bryobacteraceae bacterium]|jgi:hypothetical protein
MTPENRPSHKCISCGSLGIRRSRGHLIDRFWSLGGYRAYRCRDCRRRFHLAVPPTPPRPKNEARTESRKRKKAMKRRAVVVYFLALLAFLVVTYVITRERG